MSPDDSGRLHTLLQRSGARRPCLVGKRIGDASNILFSNGAYDPWSGGGVLSNLSASLHAIIVPSGAHHIDLMFTDPADPPDVTQVRAREMAIIAQWIRQRQPTSEQRGEVAHQLVGETSS